MTDGLDQARRQLGSAPDAINAPARALDDIGDNLNAISTKSMEFALGLLTKLAPALVDLTDKLATIDAAGFGMAIAGYIEATLKWVSATFGLGSALNSIKAAIDGIASGNFAQGFDLLFLTAKNTGLNMINVLYAAGKAAIQTTMDALSTVFASNSGFIELATYAFSYVAASFKANMADAVAEIMAGIPFIKQSAVDAMKGISEAARLEASDMTYSMKFAAEQIGKDLGSAFANGPDQFAAHYDANMKQPLFDITDSIAKQVELQQQLTDQVNLTAFAETKLGQEIDNNTQKKIAQLAGGDQKYAGMSDSQAAAAMAADSYAGAGMNAAAIAAAQKSSVSGGGNAWISMNGVGGQISATDRLKSSGTRGALADSMRIADQKASEYQRAQAAAAKGGYNTAAGIMQRADKTEQRQTENARLKDIARQNGFDNFDQMLSAANNNLPIRGQMTKDEYKNLMLGDSQSTDQKKASEDAKGGGRGKGGEGSNALQTIVQSIYTWMQTNLPSNALS